MILIKGVWKEDMKKGVLPCFILFVLAILLPVAPARADGIGYIIGHTTGSATRYVVEAPLYPAGYVYYLDRKSAVDHSLENSCEEMGARGTSADRCVEKLRKVTQEKLPESEVSSGSPIPKGRRVKYARSQVKEVMDYLRSR